MVGRRAILGLSLVAALACDDGPTVTLALDGSLTRDAAGVDAAGGADAGEARDAEPADSGPAGPDEDRDGHPAPLDCDDDDPGVYPGAPELCDGRDNDCDEQIDEGVPTDGDGCRDPGPPVRTSTVGIISVALRTADLANAGTDNNAISLCLSSTTCFRLNVPDVDDFRRGEIDVYHFEQVDLPRDQLDRVVLQSRNGTDRWVPECLQIQFDGEPVYCRAGIRERFGDDTGEIEDWVDPLGLHLGCESCYETPLTHGPMVGEVGPDSARLWFRADATRRAAVRIATSAEALVDAVAYAYPDPRRDYATQVRIQGLRPDTEYVYDVGVEGARIGPFRFRTAPAPAAGTRFNFAFGSCTKDDEQPIFSQVAHRAPELFLFVGDNHYANSANRDALRWYYRWGFERPERAALLHETPTLAVWDDHDYTGNNTDGTAPGKETALRVFREYWATPPTGTESTPGVFYVHEYGDVAFFMLDDRYHRGAQDSLLGAPQTAWLQAELRASTATFKFLVSGSQFTSHGSNDSWAAFPEATAALLDFIRAEAITGVIMLSGDIHRSEIRRMPNPGAYGIPEFTSSPMANSNSLCRFEDAERRLCVNEGNYFIDVEVDTMAADPRVRAIVIDETGAEVFTETVLASELRP